MSARTYDANGWLTIRNNPISKAGVYPYLGAEMDAPDPHRVYNVFRAPEELEKAAETFKLLPIIDEHQLLGDIGTSTDERPPAGAIGEQIRYEHPYLKANLKIYSDELKRKIAGGKIELSPAYTCTYEYKPGEYEGEKYDYIQHIQAGNHLALVSTGRTGADVAIQDHVTFAFDTGGLIMPLEELLAAVAALSDEEKAQLLAALQPVATDENQDDKQNTTDEDKTAATDDEADDTAQATEVAANAAQAAESAKEAGDDEAAEQAAATAVENAEEALAAAEELQEKIAQDAMNKAIKHIDARNAMAARVKPFIGAVPTVAMDSAETVAAYALKKLGVKHVKGQASAVITGYLHNRQPASKQVAAMDTKPISARDTAAKLWGVK